MAQSMLRRLVDESGLGAILEASRDTKILCLQRVVRLFAYGSSTLILAQFLSSIDVRDAQIGLFMTLTLLGDVLISFLLTLFADGIGRRRVLAIGAFLMAMSGLVFAVTSNFWFLVLASVVGVISPSGNETGPFRAIEESIIAQLTPEKVRTDVFSWYELFSSAGAALGTLLAGVLVQALESNGWTTTSAYRVIFFVYSILGLVKLGLNFLLSPACESEPSGYERLELASGAEESAAGAGAGAAAERTEGKQSVVSRIRSLVPAISPESVSILTKLCLLFGLDAFASGLVGRSWLSYYFTTAFDLRPALLGTIFFAANLVASASNLVAVPLAKRVGLVRTMVFTHLPSSLLLAAIPFPSSTAVATLLLVLRSCTSTMDRAPRQAFLAAAVLRSERTAVMGFVNVVKTLAQSVSPSVTGWLAGIGKFWVVFVVAGGLKAGYDVAILKMFLGFQGRGES